MLALLTLFKLVGRSYAYASGFHGGMTVVPLPVAGVEDPDDPGFALATASGVVKRVVPEPLGNREEVDVITLKALTPKVQDEVVAAVALTTGEEDLLDREITEADIAYVIDHIGVFGDDNRAGIERTLHRISAIRNRSGKVVGLTCRIGRAVFGTIDIIRDMVESGQSVLLLGLGPGQ